MLVRGVMLT